MPWDFELPEELPFPAPTGEMLRLNTGKPRLSLVPTAFIFVVGSEIDLTYEVAKVMDYGASKYALNNWRNSGPWLKVLDSGLRHLYKMMYEGEEVDDESGIHHAGHLGCNLAFILEFIRENDGTDDRYITKSRVSTGTGDNNLETVLELLLDWRDGGPDESLERATRTLARWFKTEKVS